MGLHMKYWSVPRVLSVALIFALAGCAVSPSTRVAKPAYIPPPAPVEPASVAAISTGDNFYRALNRITWGTNPSTAKHAEQLGLAAYLDEQLSPKGDVPTSVATQIDAMTISKKDLVTLVQNMEERRKAADGIKDDAEKKTTQQAYQQEMNRLAREAAVRSTLRAVYSPNQLQEQMVWFWMNHFNVHQNKANIRAMVGDYEDNAIRAHALGKFRDLVRATLHHPVMIRYLDNEQNAVNRINENYARELMELHTLGVTAGYTQRDVQELARILTGVGINLGNNTPNVKKEWKSQYVREGLWEFNPMRHDFGDKVLLGQVIKGRGYEEIDQAIDLLCRQPATAQFVSTKLARYFVADEPPATLVARMSLTFRQTDGNIGEVLRTLFSSPEFAESLGRKFKDPMHYVVSAVRLAYDDKPILNAAPMLNWLNRMGQPLYGRQTPDGYAMVESAWASPGQMTTRFEIAKAIGSGSAGLFKTDGPQPTEKPAFPQLANALYYQHTKQVLSPATLGALDQAGSPQEWNTFLLASPEMMNR